MARGPRTFPAPPPLSPAGAAFSAAAFTASTSTPLGCVVRDSSARLPSASPPPADTRPTLHATNSAAPSSSNRGAPGRRDRGIVSDGAARGAAYGQ